MHIRFEDCRKGCSEVNNLKADIEGRIVKGDIEGTDHSTFATGGYTIYCFYWVLSVIRPDFYAPERRIVCQVKFVDNATRQFESSDPAIIKLHLLQHSRPGPV